jgi:MYXO-CTERM domain-containing protein
MKLSLTQKVIAPAALAVALLGSGIGASVVSAQTESQRPDDGRSGYANRTAEPAGRFDWGWLGLLGLFGLLGKRRSAIQEPRGTYERRETYEPRPTH